MKKMYYSAEDESRGMSRVDDALWKILMYKPHLQDINFIWIMIFLLWLFANFDYFLLRYELYLLRENFRYTKIGYEMKSYFSVFLGKEQSFLWLLSLSSTTPNILFCHMYKCIYVTTQKLAYFNVSYSVKWYWFIKNTWF